MPIEQPEPNIEVPTDLQKLIEEKREQVASMELEYFRVQKLANAEKYTIQQCEARKQELEGQLASLEPIVVAKKQQIDGFNEEINNATSTLAKLQEEIRLKKVKQAEIDDENIGKTEMLNYTIAEFNEKTDQSNKREAALNKREIIFNQKVAKLKEVIKDF